MFGLLDHLGNRPKEPPILPWNIRSKEPKTLEELQALAIRWVVEHHVLPIYNVDEEDAVTLLAILVEIGAVDRDELFSGDPEVGAFRKMHWTLCNHGHVDLKDRVAFRKDVHYRESSVARTSVGNSSSSSSPPSSRGRRITSAFLGDIWSGIWEFHGKRRVLDLLAKLDALEILVVEKCASMRVTEVVARLPHLKYLRVRSYDEWNTFLGPHHVLQKMKSESNLKHLILLHNQIVKEDDLGEFLLDVLPLLPKLVTFEIEHNRIESFQRIAQRIQHHEMVSKSRLRRLNLGYYHYLVANESHGVQPRIHHPGEIEAMKTLLVTFKELHRIDGAFGYNRFQTEHSCNATVDCFLEINDTGRVLVETAQNDNDNHNESIPLSVWPVVLERAWKRNREVPGRASRGPNGIYYLLRSVPELHQLRHKETLQRVLPDVHNLR